MSAPNSEYVTESGPRRDSAYSPHGMQGPSFALLGSQKVHPRIQDWSEDKNTPGPGFAVQAYSCPETPTNVPRSLPAAHSSMALTMKCLSGLDSSFADSMPSLSSGPSSRSDSTLRSSATGIAVRPGPFDDEGHYVSDARSNSEINSSCSPVEKRPRGVSCLFGFLGCHESFTKIEWWDMHCKSHFKGRAPPSQLRCPYASCTWNTTGQDGEDAWNQRWIHFDQEHDILSRSEGWCEKPDIPLFKYLWSVQIIDGAQLQELRKRGRLESDRTPFVTTERPDRHRHRRVPRR